ncbi:hypothetical protein DPEC_G00363610 [Dallia pectoralis]|nr:hypothetical protein DPEC_G00363610 [Dallia pectoralis]
MLNKTKSMRTVSSRLVVVQCPCTSSSWRTTFRALSQTVILLKILTTTPMTTAESGRCFSTLKRIKTFLRNSMTQDRLNALAMLSMEKILGRDIPDFNKRLIERFATQKDRWATFQYK